MKTSIRTIKIDPKLAKEIQTKIDKNQPLDKKSTYKDNRVYLSLTANFKHDVDVDIKVVDTNTGPWIDVVLFNNGSEELVIEPQYIFLKEYHLKYNGNKYIVKVC